MNELIEALRERVAEIREQAALGRILEKRARELTGSIEGKIRELENRMSEQKRASEYSARSAERAQKKYADLQISALEKRLKRLEEAQAAEAERVKYEYMKISGLTKELERKFGGEKAGIFRKVSELDKRISRLALENIYARESREPAGKSGLKKGGHPKKSRSRLRGKRSGASRKRREKIWHLNVFGRHKPCKSPGRRAGRIRNRAKRISRKAKKRNR